MAVGRLHRLADMRPTEEKYKQAISKMEQATELVRAAQRLLQDAGPLSDDDYNKTLTDLTTAVDDLEQTAWQGSLFGF